MLLKNTKTKTEKYKVFMVNRPTATGPYNNLKYILFFFNPLNYSSSSSVSHSVMSNSAIPWTGALQAPLSMRFSSQIHWSGLPFPSPEGLPDPGIEPGSPALQAGSLQSELQGRSISKL